MYIDFLLNEMKKYNEDLALVTEGNEVKYRELLEEYEIWDYKLKEFGVVNNSVVAVHGEFNKTSIGLMLALLNRGVIYVPIALSMKDIDKKLSIAEVEVYIDLEINKIIKLEKVAANPLLNHLKEEKAPGLILFSSGTTGEPKATLHNLLPMFDKYRKKGKKLNSIAFLLFDHIGGFNTVMYNIANGGVLVTVKERSVEEIASLIEKYKVDVLPTTPSFINMILFSKIYEKYSFSSLKIVSYGTEPMHESTLKAFHKVFPNVILKQTYGLSEVGIMRTQSESSDSLWLKVGGDDDHQIKIIDGILWIKSKMSMLGYLNAPSPFDDEGWLNTKDRVEVKGDYIKILGRASELINVGGEKVYPAEIESIILEIEGIKDCIVISEPSPLLGNIVCTKVVIDDNLDEQEMKLKIKKYTNEKLEKYKRPVKIYFEKETFDTERFKRKR